MKGYIVLVLLVFSSFSFCQNSSNKDVSYLGHTFKYYDSVTDVTTLRDFFSENKILIKGKWRDFDFSKNTCHQLIPDCPIVTNNENLILETWIRKDKKYNWKNKSNNELLQKVIIDQKKLWKPYKTLVTEIENNEIQNFIIYKIEKPLREAKTKEIILKSYFLLGVKNNKIYRLAIQNYVEGEISNIEEFLTGIYVYN
jgi:hypothetical protein